MGIGHLVSFHVAKFVGPKLEPKHVTLDLANRVLDALKTSGELKPWRPVPTVDDVMASLVDTAKLNATYDLEAANHQARLDAFAANPVGRPELRELLGMAEGRPVTAIGRASAFTDPLAEVREISSDDPYLPLNAPQKAFVRDVTTQVDAEYLGVHLQNLEASHSTVFLPALHDGTLFSDYLGTLRRQQTVMVKGTDEAPAAYSGHTGRTAEFGAEADQRVLEQAGQLLSEVRHTPPDAPLFTVTANILRKLNVAFDRTGPVALEGLPPEAWPELFSHPGIAGVSYRGPLAEALPLYLNLMRDRLHAAFSNLDQPVALQHLADYLQLASNTHLFPRANNSMFMSHVNYALERMGLRPITHDVLDVWAYGEDSVDFRRRFFEAVHQENPSVALPKSR